MTDTITLTGLVATEPKRIRTDEGLSITSFRLASSLRRFDRPTQTWIEYGTNWYTVSAYRRLATGVAASVVKGDRVVVTGKLRLREWKSADKAGTSIEVDADAIGHDLSWGSAIFTRTISTTANSGSTPPADGSRGPADVQREENAVETEFAASGSEEDADSFLPESASLESVEAPF